MLVHILAGLRVTLARSVRRLCTCVPYVIQVVPSQARENGLL